MNLDTVELAAAHLVDPLSRVGRERLNGRSCRFVARSLQSKLDNIATALVHTCCLGRGH